MGYLDIVHEFRETVRTNEESPKVDVSDSELSERSDLKSHTSLNSHPHNLLFGPWNPLTPEQVANERRRVLEEEPRTWWWMPRYRLAELERRGLSRAEAMAKVRAESGSAP